jgi:hypothetical protein
MVAQKMAVSVCMARQERGASLGRSAAIQCVECSGNLPSADSLFPTSAFVERA